MTRPNRRAAQRDLQETTMSMMSTIGRLGAGRHVDRQRRMAPTVFGRGPADILLDLRRQPVQHAFGLGGAARALDGPTADANVSASRAI